MPTLEEIFFIGFFSAYILLGWVRLALWAGKKLNGGPE